MNSVCVTGVTSFTGAWIAKALANEGFKVFGLCRQKSDKYGGLKKKRLEFIQSDVELFFDLPVESLELQSWILEHQPQVWVHHHHHMDGYRGDQYSWGDFERSCVSPLPALLESLTKSHCKGIVYSGTVFEPGEALGEAESKYAASKRKVWMDLKNLSDLHKILLSKVVIPNPFGPFENEDRLVPEFLRSQSASKSFELKNPHEIRNFITVDLLAATYVKAVHDILGDRANVFRPQGWLATNEVFLKILATQLSLTHEAPQGVGASEKDLSQGLERDSFWSQVAKYYDLGPSLID